MDIKYLENEKKSLENLLEQFKCDYDENPSAEIADSISAVQAELRLIEKDIKEIEGR